MSILSPQVLSYAANDFSLVAPWKKSLPRVALPSAMIAVMALLAFDVLSARIGTGMWYDHFQEFLFSSTVAAAAFPLLLKTRSLVRWSAGLVTFVWLVLGTWLALELFPKTPLWAIIAPAAAGIALCVTLRRQGWRHQIAKTLFAAAALTIIMVELLDLAALLPIRPGYITIDNRYAGTTAIFIFRYSFVILLWTLVSWLNIHGSIRHYPKSRRAFAIGMLVALIAALGYATAGKRALAQYSFDHGSSLMSRSTFQYLESSGISDEQVWNRLETADWSAKSPINDWADLAIARVLRQGDAARERFFALVEAHPTRHLKEIAMMNFPDEDLIVLVSQR